MRYDVTGYYISDSLLKRLTAYGQPKLADVKAVIHRREYTGADAVAICEWLNTEYNKARETAYGRSVQSVQSATADYGRVK